MTRRTTLGFEAIDFAHEVLGLVLMPWQRWLLVRALELDERGKLRYRTIVVLVARQNGKTLLMQVWALWRMFVDVAPLVIGTAQKLDVAEEAWQGAVELAHSNPELEAEVVHVDRTNGKKALRLVGGQRYKVAAAGRRGGRGLSGDMVVLDELREHQSWDAWAAVSKTTMARPEPQIVGFSNAGDAQSVVLAHLRSLAVDVDELTGAESLRADVDPSIGWFEWSAPAGADLRDHGGWAWANPALGHTIDEESILAALATDPEDVFRTEVLCQQVHRCISPLIPPDEWDTCEVPGSQAAGPLVFGLDVSPTRGRSSIDVAGRALDADDRWHVELVDNRSGTDWLLPRMVELAKTHGSRKVALDPASPAGALIPALTKADLDVMPLTSREFAQACGLFHDAVTGHRLQHIGQEQLDAAVFAARTKPLGEGWKFTHRGSGEDLTPLFGATVALWGAVAAAEADYDVLDSVL